MIGLRDAANDTPEQAIATLEGAPDGEQPLFLDEFTDTPDFVEDMAQPSRWRTIGAVALAVLSILWVVALLALAWKSLPMMEPVGVAQFAAALLAMPLLAGIVWLIALRTSSAEARRFGATARAMREEAAMLEQTVAALTAAVAANRAQLSEQAQSLSALGDTATQRLAAIGSGLSDEVAAASAHARTLADTARAAQDNLATLMAGLPCAQEEIAGLVSHIDRAGLAAGEQAAALDVQVSALAERGREAETVAGGAAQKLAAHIARMEATSETAGARLEAVTAEMSSAVDAMLGRTAGAIDQSRQSIAAQGDAMLAMVGAHQAALDSAAKESADSLAERINLIELVIDRIAERLSAQRGASDALLSTLDTGIAATESKLEALHQLGVERSNLLAASISALNVSADAMTEALRAGDDMASRAIGTTESLLIALDSAAREMEETMPAAVDRLDSRFAASKSVVTATKPELLALVTAAESTHDAIEAIAQVIAEQRRNVEALTGTLLESLTAGRAKADAIGQMVDEASERAASLSEEAAPRLVEAMLRVRETASQAAEHARDTLASVIPEAAEALEKSGVAALRQAVDKGFEQTIGELSRAAENAIAAAIRATAELDQQIRKIDEQAALVESKIELAHSEREDQARESFAKRASLLIEALNSASIDITRTFSPEVADSAWSAYLKGDRGVFTRRAVRLLDSGEQRDIARLYDDDSAFRDQVNRYIHDFESMLRTILTQRDGSPLGVTLLSSDMGKLYVALAQAIERLR
ncbi:MAG: hypothetical protein QM688_10950 [Sphingomonas bacterium]